jgi:tetratricopeptide (TPR) repeat protein
MSIFISYSRQDQAYVNKLLEALTKHELPWWLDNKIDYGDKWPRVIEENLRKSQVFMLVMSPRSKNSHWVNCELALALELKKPIFPLLLEGSRWLEVGIIQTVDIQGGKLPPASFFDRVRSELNNKVRSKLNHKTVQLTAEEWFNSAYNKGESGDYQGAIADYNQAIKIKPDYADAYINRGNAKYNLGDKQGAIADYNQAIKIKPDYAYAYNNRGIAKKNLGDKQGAIADYNQAINIKPDYADAYYNRGIAKSDLGDKQGAIADYNQAAQLYAQQNKMVDYQDALNQVKNLEK